MSFEWTDEKKQEVIEMYKDQEPTPETSSEIVNKIAEDIGAQPNGVRMILIKAEVYVKKTPAAASASKGEGSKRVSKADAQEALTAAISAKGLQPDEDIISKMTGKAAMYFTEILNA
jgi:transposase-like protein